MDRVDVGVIVHQLADAFTFARKNGQIERDEEARDLWHGIYDDLSAGTPGLVGALTGRAEAQVMRLAHIYALLEKSPHIRRDHLEAALAVWDYCLSSVRSVFCNPKETPSPTPSSRSSRKGNHPHPLRDPFRPASEDAYTLHRLRELWLC